MRQINKIFMIIAALFLLTPAAFAMEGHGWDNQNTKIKGSWSIEQRADGDYLVLSDEFKTRGAPDLKLFLSKQEFNSIKGSNATNGAVLISKLQSNKGAQSYKIPADVNLADYESLILHCEQYSKLWASTPLQ